MRKTLLTIRALRKVFSYVFVVMSLFISGGLMADINAQGKRIAFSLTGGGDFIITDSQGRRIGYDFDKKQTVNEIPDATIVPSMGEDAPRLQLPFMPAEKKPYTVAVSGKTLKREVNVELEIVGPGFVVGFEKISLDPSEVLNMTVSADAMELGFTASADGETPTIYLTTSQGREKPSYKFQIGIVKLSGGKTFSVKLDLANGALFFKDDDKKQNKYDVMMRRTNPGGTRDAVEIKAFSLNKTDNYKMDFGKWDGKGKPEIIKQVVKE